MSELRVRKSIKVNADFVKQMKIIMENTMNQENNNQPIDDKHLNIETVIPDSENVRPLSRQESLDVAQHPVKEVEINGETDDEEEGSQTTENEKQIATHDQALGQEIITDNPARDKEESVDKTASESDPNDPGADIETVSP